MVRDAQEPTIARVVKGFEQANHGGDAHVEAKMLGIKVIP